MVDAGEPFVKLDHLPLEGAQGWNAGLPHLLQPERSRELLLPEVSFVTIWISISIRCACFVAELTAKMANVMQPGRSTCALLQFQHRFFFVWSCRSFL